MLRCFYIAGRQTAAPVELTAIRNFRLLRANLFIFYTCTENSRLLESQFSHCALFFSFSTPCVVTYVLTRQLTLYKSLQAVHWTVVVKILLLMCFWQEWLVWTPASCVVTDTLADLWLIVTHCSLSSMFHDEIKVTAITKQKITWKILKIYAIKQLADAKNTFCTSNGVQWFKIYEERVPISWQTFSLKWELSKHDHVFMLLLIIVNLLFVLCLCVYAYLI